MPTDNGKGPEAWMPIYIGDYLGDTQRLTTEQHGAYLLLIFDYWRNGPAPDDDAVLASIAKLDRSRWKAHRASLARMFQIVDGEWRHRRIDRELETARENQDRRSSKAKKAAQARWGDAASNAPSMPQALLDECPPPSPSSSPKGSEDEEEDASASIVADPVRACFDAWNAMAIRSGVRKADKLTSARRTALRARIADYTEPVVMDAIAAVPFKPWLMGINDRKWKANIDWLLRPDSITKLREGTYDHGHRGQPANDQRDIFRDSRGREDPGFAALRRLGGLDEPGMGSGESLEGDWTVRG